MSLNFIIAEGRIGSIAMCVTTCHATGAPDWDQIYTPRHNPNVKGAIRYLQQLRRETKGVEFTDEERELLADSFVRVREYMVAPECATLLTRLAFIEAQIFGTTGVDWDAELRTL